MDTRHKIADGLAAAESALRNPNVPDKDALKYAQEALLSVMTILMTQNALSTMAQDELREVAFGTITCMAIDRANDAMSNWPPFNSAHEGFGVLLEEVDELKAHVWTKQKNRDIDKMRNEALDVAAMGMRFAFDVCNELTGRK